MRGKLPINREWRDVMIDTGAAVNVITNEVKEDLGLKIVKGSRVRCVLANGDKIASKGKTMLELEIGENIVPIEVEVIEANGYEIIIGNETLQEVNANIDFKDKVVTLEIDGDTLEIPVSCTRKLVENIEEYDENEDELFDIDEESEYDECELWDEVKC